MKNLTIKLLLSGLAVITANSIITMAPSVITEKEGPPAFTAEEMVSMPAEATYLEQIPYGTYEEQVEIEPLAAIKLMLTNPARVRFGTLKKYIDLLSAADIQTANTLDSNGQTLLDIIVQKQNEVAPQNQTQYSQVIELLKAKGARRTQIPIEKL